MLNEFIDFLKSDRTQHKIIISKYGRKDTLLTIKYYYDPNNIFLYTKFSYGNELNLNKSFHFAGFYNLKLDTLYDVGYDLKNTLNLENIKVANCNELKNTINSLVIKKASEIINNDIKNIDELKQKRY